MEYFHFLICGMKLREHWNVVQKYSHEADIVIVALLLIAGIWYVKSRWNRSES